MKKAFVEKLDLFFEEHSIEKYDYSVVAFDSNKQVLDIMIKHIEEKYPGYKIKVQPIAINVCAHCGPGTIGLLVVPNINGKSIYEYLK